MHYHAKAPGGGFHATGRTAEEAARLLDHLCGMEPDGIEPCTCQRGEDVCPPICVECEQVGTLAPCGWCGEKVCTECLGTHARECHEEECMCEACIDRRVCAAEARADALEDR